MQESSTPEDVKATEDLKKILGTKAKIITGSHDGASYATHPLRSSVETISKLAVDNKFSIVGLIVGADGEAMYQCYGNMGMIAQNMDSLFMGILESEKFMREQYDQFVVYDVGHEYLAATVKCHSAFNARLHQNHKGAFPEAEAAFARFFPIVGAIIALMGDRNSLPMLAPFIQKFNSNNYELLELIATTDPEFKKMLDEYAASLDSLGNRIKIHNDKKAKQ